jgi:hypothetical protein
MWTGQRNAAGRFLKKDRTLSDWEKHQRWLNKAKLTPEGRARQLLWRANRVSKEKGWTCDLDLNWIATRIAKGVCEKTGVKFVIDGGMKHKFAPSLDRIDCSRGYEKDNVRVVIWQFNQCRMSYSDAELLEFAFILVRKHFTEAVGLDDDDDLDTPGTGAVASDDNDDYWNSADLVAVAGGVSCCQ